MVIMDRTANVDINGKDHPIHSITHNSIEIFYTH